MLARPPLPTLERLPSPVAFTRSLTIDSDGEPLPPDCDIETITPVADEDFARFRAAAMRMDAVDHGSRRTVGQEGSARRREGDADNDPASSSVRQSTTVRHWRT